MHRSDFKQALSTFQQLKQKEEGASQSPTYSNRNQQGAQSSSSWWKWQGSWWTLHSYESHDGDEPSIDRTGVLLYSIGNNSSGQDFLEFNYFVTDGSFTADGGLL